VLELVVDAGAGVADVDKQLGGLGGHRFTSQPYGALLLRSRPSPSQPSPDVRPSAMPPQTSPRVEFFSFLAVALSCGGWLTLIFLEAVRGELTLWSAVGTVVFAGATVIYARRILRRLA